MRSGFWKEQFMLLMALAQRNCYKFCVSLLHFHEKFFHAVSCSYVLSLCTAFQCCQLSVTLQRVPSVFAIISERSLWSKCT